MKLSTAFFFLVFSVGSVAQNLQNTSAFSEFTMSFLGGVNFNKIPTVGGSMQFEGKTNITSSLNLKISLGYSGTFEEKKYTVKSHRYFKINDQEGYQLQTYSINKMKHTVFPVNIGMEYVFYKETFSPFGILETGYNFYNSEERVNKSESGQTFDNENSIPADYRNPAPGTIAGSSLGIGIGLGTKYNLSSTASIEFRYVYRWNDLIINTNQILVGLTF